MSLRCIFGHRFRRVSAQTYTTVGFRGYGAPANRNRTAVLRRCDRCAEVEVKVLTGHWTLEELER